MVWDGLSVLILLTLAVAGWNVGIVNSWRGPFAVILATLAAQQFYVDFATWILQQLRVTPDQAVAIGYVLMWIGLEIIFELLLNVVLPFNKKDRPMVYERLLGAGLGILKGFVVILFPLIALMGPIKIPHAPSDKSALINPMDSGIDKAMLLPIYTNVARGLVPIFGRMVMSDKEPSFKPNFAGTTTVDEEEKNK